MSDPYVRRPKEVSVIELFERSSITILDRTISGPGIRRIYDALNSGIQIEDFFFSRFENLPRKLWVEWSKAFDQVEQPLTRFVSRIINVNPPFDCTENNELGDVKYVPYAGFWPRVGDNIVVRVTPAQYWGCAFYYVVIAKRKRVNNGEKFTYRIYKCR